MDAGQFALLKTRRFLPLFITQFLGAFNDNVFKNALAILITYRIAQQAGLNAQILVALATAIFILPFFLFSATAGQLADKYEKASLIKIIKFAEIILALCAAGGFYLQSVNLLLFVLFLLGLQATFFGPIKYAILPQQLFAHELIAGNGLIEAGTFIAILLGTILGGILILLPAGEAIISAIIFLLALSGFLSSLAVPKTHTQNLNLVVHYNFIAETFNLLRYVRSQRDIYLAILGISWFWLVGAIFLSEFPVFTKDILHANEHVVTLFFALFSIGIAVGSLLCNTLLKGEIHTTYVPFAALGMTVFIVDLYFAAHAANQVYTATFLLPRELLSTFNGWRIVIDLLLIAICGGIYTVPLYALLQHQSEETHRARVIASNNIMNALFMVIAALVTMLLLALNFSVNQVFLIVAIANGLVAIYICKLLPAVLIRQTLRWMLNFFYHVKVVGLENYTNAGQRVVIVANHTSFLDGALLAAFLPDKLIYAVDTITAQKWWIKLFLTVVDTFLVNPSNPMALKSLIELVKQNRRCVIFPEGRLTVTGALMKIYEGPGLVADKANAALLPIYIQGAQFTPFSRLKGKVRIRWMTQIVIHIFPAQLLAVNAELKGRKRRLEIGLKLYEAMTAAIFASNDYTQTLFYSLLEARHKQGRRYNIVEDIQRNPMNYQQFITRCFILGGVVAKDTRFGEYVGVLLPNTISTAILFFALQAYSRVPAMLNFAGGTKNILSACVAAQIKIIYTSTQFLERAKLTETVASLKNAGIKIIYLEDLRPQINVFDKLRAFLFAQCPHLAYKFINRANESLHADATAVVLFTSGSEGTPKGVVLSHKNIQANRFQMSACIDFARTDKILNTLPIFHSFGLTVGMILPLLSGVKVFFYPSPLHYRIVPELSYDINATILFGTDTFLAGYAKYANPYDFYSLRYVFAGAEKLRHENFTQWACKFGVRVFEGYGTTETSPVLATNTPTHNCPGTVGRLLPGIQYQLKPVPGIAEGGVLWVAGPNIMQGYLKVENPGVLIPPTDGWYDTGDVVTINSSGYITIQGRVKRFAKIGGEMISLVMIEQQITLLWPEHQHVVLNVPDAKKGEQLVLVTTYPGATRELLVGHVRANQLGELVIPKKIIILKKLPLLKTGKIDYLTLKEQVLQL